MTTAREKTKFHGLTIVHPHSGKVSRSEVKTIVKHLSNGYNRESDKQNAEKLLKYGEGVIILDDVNGSITGRTAVYQSDTLY